MFYYCNCYIIYYIQNYILLYECVNIFKESCTFVKKNVL